MNGNLSSEQFKPGDRVAVGSPLGSGQKGFVGAEEHYIYQGRTGFRGDHRFTGVEGHTNGTLERESLAGVRRV